MRPKLRKLMSVLALPALLSGCSPGFAVIATEELCRSWRHQSVSKSDVLTQGTAEGIEGNNDARPAWGCELGKDQAKG